MFSHALGELKGSASGRKFPVSYVCRGLKLYAASLSDHDMKGHPTLIAPAELEYSKPSAQGRCPAGRLTRSVGK